MKYLLLFSLFAWPLLAQETPQPAAPPAGEAEKGEDVGSLPVPIFGEESPETHKEVRGYDPGGSLLTMTGNLLLVLGLILLLAWLVQRYLPKRLGALGESKQLRLIQSLPMGPRRFVSLVEADGKRYLLGVTDNQINLLKALDETSFDEALSAIEEPKRVGEMMPEPRRVREMMEDS